MFWGVTHCLQGSENLVPLLGPVNHSHQDWPVSNVYERYAAQPWRRLGRLAPSNWIPDSFLKVLGLAPEWEGPAGVSGKALPSPDSGDSLECSIMTDVTGFMVHLCKEGFLLPKSLCLGGGRMQGGTRGGRQVVWVCGHVAWLLGG